ncbi:WbqC family protein [Oceaniglobus roseus]|uniref:WbqC family protein n=1 Tax=Oceaniglobus roseus TaxID=1737570 RepID=UPI000C7F1E50|nr:WbqC family protein [Kandeliimicrobium roseum]
MTTLAVMQPTFAPWLGYFALIDRADLFLFLDDVQLSRQSWQTRNRLKGPDGPVTLSLAVARKPSKPKISEARLADTDFAAKLKAKAETLLGKAPHAETSLKILSDNLDAAEGSLMKLNTGIIEGICAAVGLDGARRNASDMEAPPGEKAERLVALCRAAEADTYLSPVGAYDYLAGDTKFEDAGIDLRFLNYSCPEYPQPHPPFVSHLSALDALAQVGPDGFLPLLREGYGDDLTLTDMERPAP